MTSSKLNLFRIASENGKPLDDQLSTAFLQCETDVQTTLKQFMDWLFHEGHVSLNLQPFILACFIQTGTYQNIYEWALEQETLSGRSRDECLRERLGDFYDRRIAFDGAFEDGEHFRYGALNVKSPGFTSKFGKFCAVLKREFVDSVDMAYLPEDSLTTYLNELGEMDLSAFTSAVAPHSHRHVLAVIKHFDTIPDTPETSWPTLILSDDTYIEAIFTERFSQEDVHEVRIRQEDYTELWDLAFSDFGKKLSIAEKALVVDFIAILKASHDGLFFHLEVLS